MEFKIGDRVRICRCDRHLSTLNGHVGTVTNIYPEQLEMLEIKLDDVLPQIIKLFSFRVELVVKSPSKKFWMVFGVSPNSFRYKSREEAEAVARRCSLKHPAITFHVLETVADVTTEQPKVVVNTY